MGRKKKGIVAIIIIMLLIGLFLYAFRFAENMNSFEDPITTTSRVKSNDSYYSNNGYSSGSYSGSSYSKKSYDSTPKSEEEFMQQWNDTIDSYAYDFDYDSDYNFDY